MVHLISIKVREFSECIQPAQQVDVVNQHQRHEESRRRRQSEANKRNNNESFTRNGSNTSGSNNTAEDVRERMEHVGNAYAPTHANASRISAERTKSGRVATDEPEANDVEVEDARKTEFPLSERWRIWKNVLALGFAFMIHFTAFWGASNLQSSINADEALGTFTLAAIYGSLILSNIFLPVIVIKFLGCKWTSSISLIAYMPFILSQFYPRFYTMIPAGLAVGLGGGPLWCAKCTYLTVVAETYSQIVGVSSDVIVTRFFGVFFMFYQFSQVWGNLISSAVLSNTDDIGPLGNSSSEFVTNVSMNVLTSLDSWGTIDMLKSNETQAENLCGANFEPNRIIATDNPNLAPPPSHKIQLIAGIYLACMIVACLIVAFFVDSLTRYNKGRTGSGSGLSGMRLLAVTMKQLSNPYQLLILPITMFIGAEQAFLAADYTASFVSCGWGIQNIGYVMICFGVCNAMSALCTGSIVKITGRAPVIAVALIIHVVLIVTLQLWAPTPTSTNVYFIVAGCWGIADAIWLVQINSLYGILFPGQEEASYSNFRLWEATGSVITYAYSPYLSTSVKIFLLLGLLIIGVCGYAVIEFLEYGDKKRNRNERIIAEKNKFKLVHGSTTNSKSDKKLTSEVAH